MDILLTWIEQSLKVKPIVYLLYPNYLCLFALYQLFNSPVGLNNNIEKFRMKLTSSRKNRFLKTVITFSIGFLILT